MTKILAKFLRTVPAFLLLVLSTVLLFDIGCFFVLPENFSGLIFLGYRVGLLPDGSMGRGYPHRYYEEHPERGFDIGRSKSQRDHFVFDYPKNYSYPIWSNSLGCFDTEHADLQHYIYLTGDSTTWGYTRFEKKFGTLLHDKLQVPVVKCGVTHTGQLHQLSKMKEVVDEIGKPPAIILLVWSSNDIINDAFYPHSTVIDGWQVDTTYFNSSGEVVRDSSDVLTEQVRNKVNAYNSLWRKPKWFLIKYSATYNILCRVFGLMPLGLWLRDSMFDSPHLRDIYWLQRSAPGRAVLSYRDDELSRKNQDALLKFKTYADTIHAKVLVALLSDRKNYNAEVRDFLREHSIKYIDLGDEGYNFDDKRLSWRIDGHPNEEGNKVIADALYRFIQPELGDDSRKLESLRN